MVEIFPTEWSGQPQRSQQTCFLTCHSRFPEQKPYQHSQGVYFEDFAVNRCSRTSKINLKKCKIEVSHLLFLISNKTVSFGRHWTIFQRFHIMQLPVLYQQTSPHLWLRERITTGLIKYDIYLCNNHHGATYFTDKYRCHVSDFLFLIIFCMTLQYR